MDSLADIMQSDLLYMSEIVCTISYILNIANSRYTLILMMINNFILITLVYHTSLTII